MARIVNLYLIVTGITTALVLMMPWLVVLGFFALILPGLILGWTPTAFLWGLGFALPWYLLRPILGDYLAIVPAMLMAAAIFWFGPQPSFLQSRARLAQTIRPEIVPAAPIRLAGHVRVDVVSRELEQDPPGVPYDRAASERRPYVCDALCAALLATPGVKSVTVNAHGYSEQAGAALTPHARTFRVVPRSDCAQPTVRPRNADALGLDRPSRGIVKAAGGFVATRQAEWDVRLSTTDCIVAEAPRTEHDFIIREHSYRAFAADPPRSTSWSLGPLSVSVERLDVTDGTGTPLLSKTLASTQALKRPLHIAAAGGLDNFRFEWGRKRLSNGSDYQLSANQLLADHTNLRTEADRAAIVRASRERLAQALDDATLPASDPAFRLAEPWLRSLEGQTATDGDARLLVRAIRDPRVTNVDGIWGAIKALGDRAADLRAPMVERIASADLSMGEPPKSIGRALNSLPPGTFVSMTETERSILADPQRRVLAPGLISRQSDRGAAAEPVLLEMLDYHLRKIADNKRKRGASSDGDLVVVDRVRMAFCQLGPAASAALPVIDALTSQGLVDRRFAEDREWHLMLARMGKPIEDIPKPQNLSGSEAQFHRNLQQRLDRFRPDRDCRGQWS